jgi:hypothetical protein
MPHEGADVQIAPNQSHFARSASYHNIPALAAHHNGRADIKKTFSEVNLARTAESDSLPDRDGFATGKDILRRTSRRASGRNQTKNEPCFTLPADSSPDSEPAAPKPPTGPITRPEPSLQSRSMTEAFANFTRKKWRASSGQLDGVKPASVQSARLVKAGSTRAREPTREQATHPTHEKQSESPPKRSRGPLQALTGKGKTDSSSTLSSKTSLQSLRRRASRDRVTASVVVPNQDIPPVPQAPKSQTRPSKPAESPKKKDELWSVFRGLDADYQKYALLFVYAKIPTAL